ncbi:sensor histidine kinase, partial [Singulisphaera rosea]
SASARQLARLVTNTLTLMRADDFRRTLQCVPVELAPLLRGVVDQVQPFIRARKLELRVEVADDLGVFEVDPDKIGAAVVNLLTNAIKFTPDGGVIALTGKLISADEAEIEIRDEGIGMEPRALAYLFQPFFTQFDSSRHSSGDFGFNKRGLGLGLSIVKQFVELHGGRVSAESTVDVGTKVTIRLPRRQVRRPVDGGGDHRDGSEPSGA